MKFCCDVIYAILTLKLGGDVYKCVQIIEEWIPFYFFTLNINEIFN